MKSVQFRGNNFCEVVNFCTQNEKVKNLIGFEINDNDGKKIISIKTTKSVYDIEDCSFIFLKRNKLYFYETASAFKELHTLGKCEREFILIE